MKILLFLEKFSKTNKDQRRPWITNVKKFSLGNSSGENICVFILRTNTHPG